MSALTINADDLDAALDGVAPEPVGLTANELQFVTLVLQEYALTGEVLTRETAAEIGIPDDFYLASLTSPVVLEALAERGLEEKLINEVLHGHVEVEVKPEDEWVAAVQKRSLTPQQLIVANSMLDLVDTKSQKKKLQDLNVSTTQWNNWLKDPAFAGYLAQRAESMLGENQHEAHLALLDKVRMGDMKAIEFYYEMRGIYTKASATSQGSNVAVDVQNLLVRIIEIINDEVDSPDIAARIADRFRSLMTARTIAGELLEPGSDELVIPEVATARVLTPKLQELMERGVGNE